MLTGGGANLSQGQRQLLAIARAAVADPPVLILDEATSSIDTRTEKLVQRGMDALMTGRTSFVIAHRLSTVRNADCIMVMEQGRIIERGTHDQLMEEKGRYYQLYTGKSTARAAEMAGIGDITGTLEKDKCADMIVTEENPLDDLRALRHVKMVVARGTIMENPKVKINKRVETELDKFL